MTKKELIQKIEHLRDDDPIVIEVDNTDHKCDEWKDTYDFVIKFNPLDEDYTEIILELLPN